jgi:hypothetical protein
MGLSDKGELKNETSREVMCATCSVIRTQKMERESGTAILNERWMKDYQSLLHCHH